MNENFELDYAEIYRQNYLDAKDEIRNLKCEIQDLKIEIKTLEFTNRLLESQLNAAEKFILKKEKD